MDLPLATLIERLRVDEDTLPTLLQVKAFVVAATSSAIKNVVKASHLHYLFNCLHTNDREQIEVTCFILNSLLPIVDPLEVLMQLSQSIQNGLTHQSDVVRHLALKELGRIITTVEGAGALSESSEVIRQTVKLIADEDMSVASAAVNFLSDYGCTSPNIARTLLSHDPESSLETLKAVMSKSDAIRYRVFEVVCNIQSESQEMLDLCIDSGIISHLVKELSDDDVLLRVTCCAMLADMASSQHSLNYLEQAGVVSKMVEMLKNSHLEPFSDLYIPGVIKFFGNLCMYSGPQQVVDMYPGFCDTLFNIFDSNEPSNKQVAIETIGVIGIFDEGKLILADQGQKCVSFVKEICRIMSSGAQDMRLRAVNVMGQLLDHRQVNPEKVDAVLPITLSWYKLISSNPMDAILSLCKQPFLAIRCSGFHLLNTIAGCSWGIEAMSGFPTMTEYLLDRSTESDKASKEAKYEVVQTLVQSPRFAHVFGNQNYLKFRQFVKEGPFYVESELSTAIEEA
ncbi:26S proteasome non-ATPase regulatory subunit 5-like [Clavelina lepadiformis]|uniref:26S proteasome non-ATPase regulatory subunit 5-like n=1 Tax=Clavelina lepadiformis TaxID=159417 RepID=UPI0040414E15